MAFSRTTLPSCGVIGFCGVVLGVLSSYSVRELVALLCVVAVCVLCLFHMVQ